MKKQALLVGLTAVALFAGIGGLQSKGPQSTVGAPADEQTTREIAEQINQRHAARMHFDQNAYSVFVDRSAVFAEPGEVANGAQLIAETRPTVGHKAMVEHDSPKVTSFGQTAVAVYRQSQKEIYGEQSLSTHWTVVDTYIKKDGNWVLIAHAQVPEPLKRKATQVSPAVLSQYVGQYEWGPGYVDTITFSGGKLLAQTTDEDKPDVLLALNETTFFVEGDGDEELATFEKDASGKVIRYVIRGRGGELIAKKIK